MRVLSILVLISLLAACQPVETTPGEPAGSDASDASTADASLAPDFALTDTNGSEHRLSALRGQIVVLEWLNYDCPFVGKQYGSGNMQRLQETYTEKGVIWLSVVSSAPGEQGYFESDEMNARTAKEEGKQTAVLMDPDGTVGRLYDAQTTPQMVVINPEGALMYNGAIDDRPSTDQADIEGARNYLVEAVDAVLGGGAPELSRTEPYGCSVKYKTS